MKRNALLLAAAALAGVFALAQSDASNPVVLHSDSRLVVLDVVVTDRDGNLIRDLSKDDFSIQEDKRPQAIRNFEPVQAHQIPPDSEGKMLVRSSADLRKIGAAPVTVLVLDELNTRFEDMAHGRYAVEKFLRRQPKVLRQPTTLIAASFRQFKVLRDYTQDRDALLDSLHKYQPAMPSQLMRTSLTGTGERMAATLASVQEIAVAQAGTPGRKNLVWIGQGFPSINGELLSKNQVETIDDALRQITNVMLLGRVTLFVADPGGLQVSTNMGTAGITGVDPEQLEAWEQLDTGAIPFGGPFSFASLAPSTGGRSFTNRNDVDAEIATSIDDGGSYYTLTYAPDSANPESAKYRHIRVEVRRPGLLVMTRDGYFPTDAAEPASQKPKAIAAAAKAEKQDVQAELVNAALSPMAYNGIEVHAVKGKDGAYDVDVRSADLNWTPLASGLFHTSVSLFAVGVTAKGKVCANASREIGGDAAKAPLPGSPARTLLKLPFDVPPRAVRIRFVVRDAVTGKIGTADLEVGR